MTVFRSILILLAILAFTGWSSAVELDTIYEWKYIDYVWQNSNQKQNAIDEGEYNYEKIIPVDFQKISGNRVLVTTPRYHNNPASLSTVSTKTGDGGPLLEPYPSWDWHKRGDCSAITSVNRVYVDECDRLWIVDSGKIGDDQICPAQILRFDQETDRLMQRVEIPLSLTHNSGNSSKGRLEVQIVETEGNSCENTWVYIGDPEGYGLVIWDGSEIWRLENDDVFAPDSSATTFSVAGTNVTLELGVSSLVIPPPTFIEESYLLFKPMASVKGFAASLDELHKSNTGSNITYYRSNFTIPSQELARVYSSSGVLIGGFTTQLVVACWNIQSPLESANIAILLEDDEALQFTSSAGIINPSGNFEDQDYWLMTNRLPNFVAGNMNFSDTNFRIMGANLASLVNGTVCEPESHTVVASIEDKFFLEYETVWNTVVTRMLPRLSRHRVHN